METTPENTPLAGLNPADLLRQGAAEDTFMDDASSSFHPPPIEELAAIFPQFEILELIGKGGMGAVYKVRQKDLDRIVALKILPPAIGQTTEFSKRFTREAKALAKLNHPGIVTLHEFGQQDGLYFILMEFVDGVNLAQLMKAGRISPREALAIVPQICDALQFAHDQGIVHRDIKPENILLDRLGRVKVADFGIAKVVASVSEAPLRSGDTPVPTEAQALSLRPVKTSISTPENKLAEYDWKNLAAEGRTAYGVPQTLDGRTVLKIENSGNETLQVRLLNIEKPQIGKRKYALSGEIRYENVQGRAYLEMWSVFPKGSYFTRTLGDRGSGPMSQLAGTSDWRKFSLPFDRTGTKSAPIRIELNLFLPGRGSVFVGPLSLMEVSLMEATQKSGKSVVAIAAEEWLSVIDAGDYSRSWNDAAVFFQKSMTSEAWGESLTKFRKPLVGVQSRKIQDIKEVNELPGAPDGKYCIHCMPTCGGMGIPRKTRKT